MSPSPVNSCSWALLTWTWLSLLGLATQRDGVSWRDTTQRTPDRTTPFWRWGCCFNIVSQGSFQTGIKWGSSVIYFYNAVCYYSYKSLHKTKIKLRAALAIFKASQEWVDLKCAWISWRDGKVEFPDRLCFTCLSLLSSNCLNHGKAHRSANSFLHHR